MLLLSWVGFGEKPNIKDQIRNDKRGVNRAIYRIDKDVYQAERKRAEIIEQIKGAARLNQKHKVESLCRVYRTNGQQIKNYTNFKSSLEKQILQKDMALQTCCMMETMTDTNNSLKSVQNHMSMPQLEKMLLQYERTSLDIETKMESMNSTMDAVFDDPTSLDDASDIVAQIYDELNIEELANFVDAPRRKKVKPVATSGDLTITNSNRDGI